MVLHLFAFVSRLGKAATGNISKQCTAIRTESHYCVVLIIHAPHEVITIKIKSKCFLLSKSLEPRLHKGLMFNYRTLSAIHYDNGVQWSFLREKVSEWKYCFEAQYFVESKWWQKKPHAGLSGAAWYLLINKAPCKWGSMVRMEECAVEQVGTNPACQNLNPFFWTLLLGVAIYKKECSSKPARFCQKNRCSRAVQAVFWCPSQSHCCV